MFFEASPTDMVREVAASPAYFNQPRQLQREVLLAQVRELLEGESSDEAWREMADLLESFVQWLHFRLDRGS